MNLKIHLYISFLLNWFSVKYRLNFPILRFLPLNHQFFPKDRFLKKMLLNRAKTVAFFFCKTIGSNNYSTIIFKVTIQFCLKGTPMGQLLVLVCPCFRENVIITCKIVSFLYTLDNVLLKNVIIFFFGNQISKWGSFEKELKRADFWPTFHDF